MVVNDAHGGPSSATRGSPPSCLGCDSNGSRLLRSAPRDGPRHASTTAKSEERDVASQWPRNNHKTWRARKVPLRKEPPDSILTKRARCKQPGTITAPSNLLVTVCAATGIVKREGPKRGASAATPFRETSQTALTTLVVLCHRECIVCTARKGAQTGAVKATAYTYYVRSRSTATDSQPFTAVHSPRKKTSTNLRLLAYNAGGYVNACRVENFLPRVRPPP